MLTSSYQTRIYASIDSVRKLLRDSMENPQEYMQGVEDSKVLEHFPDGVVRETRKHGQTVRERISVAEMDKEVILTDEILEHPLYAGKITTRAVPTSVQNPMAPLDLEVILELEKKSFQVEGIVQADEELESEIKAELQQMKKKAENMERHA